ncbi:MAG: hypothetical protein HOV87_23350 [Catenulispora sp.]|nr:hypothetical protein [Catenulispora sp.]
MNAVSGLLTPAPTASTVLADGNSLDKTKPGLVAFLIILVMGLALWALLKNMGKQLGRAKEHFEAEEAALAAAAAPAPAAAASPASATAADGKAESVADVPKQDGPKEPQPKKDSAAE